MRSKIRLMMTIYLLSSLQTFATPNSINLTNGEWPPYLGQHLSHHGFASHIVQKAFSNVGITVNYMFLPWQRAYHYAQTGKGLNQVWHGTVVWIRTANRAMDFFYSDVVVRDDEVLFYLKSSPLHWQHINDLRGKVIGGTQHTAYPIFEKAEKNGILRIQRAGNYFDLFNRLIGKRIDAIPQVTQVGQYYLRTQLTEQQRALITNSSNVIQTREYYLIINKKITGNKQLVEKFNLGLKAIKKTAPIIICIISYHMVIMIFHLLQLKLMNKIPPMGSLSITSFLYVLSNNIH